MREVPKVLSNSILSKKETNPDKPFLKLQFSHITKSKSLPGDAFLHSTHYYVADEATSFLRGEEGGVTNSL